MNDRGPQSWRRFLVLRSILSAIAAIGMLAMLFQCQSIGDPLETPAGRRLTELIAVLNSGSYDAIRDYAAAGFSEELVSGALDAKVDALMRIHAASEGLTFVRVLSASHDRVIAEVSNRLAEMNQVFGVSVERMRPNRISMWYRGPAYLYERPGSVPQLNESEIVAGMDSFLDRLSAAGVFSGAILIGKDDSILLQRAIGPAHRDLDVPNVLETRFNIASVGKLFTAVAVAQLTERGLLSYGDPVSLYLGPDWIAADIASEIRIEHLLTHRSGLGDFLESDAMLRASAPPRTLDDYKSIIRAEQPEFPPGSRFRYSNSGFVLLGAVVERVVGQAFGEYCQEHVSDPAGILGPVDPPRDTVPLPAPAFATGYTSHFTADGRSWTDNTARMATVAPSPAGGQYASVGDLWRFATALQTGILVRDSTWQQLSEPARVEGGPPSGYGFEISDYGQERVVGHGGSHDGIGAVLDLYLRSGYTVIVLSNSDRSAFFVREKFASLVLR